MKTLINVLKENYLKKNASGDVKINGYNITEPERTLRYKPFVIETDGKKRMRCLYDYPFLYNLVSTVIVIFLLIIGCTKFSVFCYSMIKLMQ